MKFNKWPRNNYAGPGGGLYKGPGFQYKAAAVRRCSCRHPRPVFFHWAP